MRHHATPRFWRAYYALPIEVQRLADEKYALLKENPGHPSLHFKQVGDFLSARVGLHHRALGVRDGEDVAWFWIGNHDEYERLIGG